ncbi:MAG: hypothetical protein AB7P11_03145 [Hydrogenophaga sp.]|uniref:hypothetical protein n=1 Tax=Hydrogenophaga sp. TaxID=1904254 RepID=UPI003D1486CB
MPTRHLLLALSVVFVWGTNFVVIRWGLNGLPRPTAPWRKQTGFGVLVPVFGMSASALLLGEPLPIWKLGAAALVMCGLAVIVCWPLWQAARTRNRQAISPGA